MVPAWLDKKREIPSDVRALTNLARENNCWIYHIRTRIFYTPDEFMSQWTLLYTEGMKGLSNNKEFAVKSPYVAIKQRAEWVNKANEELQAILTKLESYEAEFKPQK
ncbi:hypothetical protein ACFX5U_08440 [Sphingobacterium sp. SG20118]|uniref:hypothetical protein n=1 Tax=Sphingobacterium sp. SG20118 TaxID=3367156 RepID=UPI0037DFC298